MIKKPWTPDHCPLQVGSVVYDPHTNSDRMVIRRLLSYEDNCANEDKNLVILDVGVTYSGKQLMESGFTYYPEWPCTLDELPCYDEVKEDQPDIMKLAQYVFNGLVESKYAVKGVHYTGDDKGKVWNDDIHSKVSNIILALTDLFEEDKHDEQ